jgi:hypothetical protein
MTQTFGTPEDELMDFERYVEELRPHTAQYVREWIRSVRVEEVPLFYYKVMIDFGLALEPTADTRRRLIDRYGVEGAKRYLLTQMILKIR